MTEYNDEARKTIRALNLSFAPRHANGEVNLDDWARVRWALENLRDIVWALHGNTEPAREDVAIGLQALDRLRKHHVGEDVHWGVATLPNRNANVFEDGFIAFLLNNGEISLREAQAMRVLKFDVEAKASWDVNPDLIPEWALKRQKKWHLERQTGNLTEGETKLVRLMSDGEPVVVDEAFRNESQWASWKCDLESLIARGAVAKTVRGDEWMFQLTPMYAELTLQSMGLEAEDETDE